VLWDKASLVSMDETHQFYVHELQPFISVWSVGQQTDSSQRHSVAEVRRQTDMNNVTLYGSTQLAVDLAELAAEVGDVTLAANDAGSTDCSQSRHTTVESCGERLRASECHEVTADAPIALDGFCLQSSSVSSIRKFTACQPILVVCVELRARVFSTEFPVVELLSVGLQLRQ